MLPCSPLSSAGADYPHGVRVSDDFDPGQAWLNGPNDGKLQFVLERLHVFVCVSRGGCIV